MRFHENTICYDCSRDSMTNDAVAIKVKDQPKIAAVDSNVI
jgi:hypothetical protein